MSMRESLKLASFIFIGTLGLLANELVFHLGTVAVLTFAALSVIGLVILAGKTWGIKDKKEDAK